MALVEDSCLAPEARGIKTCPQPDAFSIPTFAKRGNVLPAEVNQQFSLRAFACLRRPLCRALCRALLENVGYFDKVADKVSKCRHNENCRKSALDDGQWQNNLRH